MSDREPTAAYAYQPGPVSTPGGLIFGVSGPGAESFRDARYATRAEAEKVASDINRKRLTAAALRGFNTPALRSCIKIGGRWA